MAANLPSTPAEHGRLLHPVGASGRPVIAWRDGGNWRQQSVTIPDLPDALAAAAGQKDIYLTMNRFYFRRVIAQTAELNAMFSDLDYYKIPELADWHPWRVLERVLTLLEDASLPPPSFAISTGRGLAVVWLHTPVPRHALPRWNAAQVVLADALSPAGADQGARDAARVLRLVGTVNSKNSVKVEALGKLGATWDFGDLCDQILPLTRLELEELRKERAARAQGKPQQTERRLWLPGQNLFEGRLWEARLEDLQKLLEIRWMGQLPPGQRDAWLFSASIGMTYLTDPQNLRRDLFHLAREVTRRSGKPWDEKETKDRLYSVMQRAQQAAKGETIGYRGQRVDPRYRQFTETIIRNLNITEDEMQHMRVILPPDLRQERIRLDKERARREQGVMERGVYLKQAHRHTLSQRERARELRQDGLNNRRIAENLGVSERHVRRLLADEAAARDLSPDTSLLQALERAEDRGEGPPPTHT